VQAWAQALRAWEQGSANGIAKALAAAERALEIDGSCLRALHAVRLLHFTRALYGVAEREDAIAAGLEAVRRAHAIDPRDHMVYFGRGMLRTLVPDHDGAVVDLRYAHQLNPNDTHILIALGWAEALVGEWEIGIEHLELALRLSPRDPWKYQLYLNMAIATRIGRDYERSRDYAQLSLRERPDFVFGHLNLALACEALGDIGNARRSLEEVRKLAPGLTEKILAGPVLPLPPVVHERAASAIRRLLDASVS
jgi:tetratricopeptide (TPR) repeat protein